MKRIFALLLFLFALGTVVLAQGNGNSGNGNTNSSNYSGNSNYWANSNLPPAVISYLQNGGQMPMYLVAKVLGAVKDWGMQNFGLSLSQMLQLYNAGKLTITLVATSPPTLTFFVAYGGWGTIAILDNF